MAKTIQLRSKEDIRLAIRRRGREIAAKMSDKEFFESPDFFNYAARLTDFILRKHKLYKLVLQYAPNNPAFTAYTDGKDIVVNTGSDQVRKPKLLEKRFMTCMGSIFHEAAHKLFLDFDAHRKVMKTLSSGKLVGSFQTGGNADLEKAREELRSVVESPYAEAVASIYASLSNIVSDGHDEAAMKRHFPGFIAECIDYKNRMQVELTPTLQEMIDDREDSYSIRSALLLEYGKYGFYKTGDSVSPEAQEHLDFVTPLEEIIDAAVLEDDYMKRWDYLNVLMLHLWPCLREKFPKNPQGSQQSSSGNQPGGAGSSQGNQNGQGQRSPNGSTGSSGNGSSGSSQGQQNTPTPEEVNQAMQQLAQAIQKATASAPAPVNCNGKAVNAQQIQAGGASPGSGSDATAIALGAAQQAAKESVQKELDEAQMEAIRNNDQPLIHQRVRYEIHRHFPRASKKAYDKIYKEIEPYVRNLVQEMKRIFTDMNDEHLMRHLRFGPVIEATEGYRQDKRIFAKKKLPEEMPDMAICILIDMSGSMYGNKIECAKKTAILIERFASELNIPIMVAGHDVECCVNIRIFTDFLSATPEKDRYSLASITDGGCNRDGLAINICADLLSKRPEKTKLMVVISDGAPADSGYSGKAARDDIASIVKKYRRNGMMIYGAAIDQDRKHIQEIYGNDFLNIEDLRSLPKTLVRLVKRNMTN